MMLFLGLWFDAHANPAVFDHALEVRLLPEEGRLSVRDTLTLPPGPGKTLEFSLNAGLTVRVEGPHAALETGRRHAGPVPTRAYRLILPRDTRQVVLTYEGQPTIAAPADQSGMPLAVLKEDMVYLDGTSAWFPRFGDERVTFTLRVHDLPAGWHVVSQGASVNGGWQERQPQEDIHLLAGPYHRYGRSTPWGEALAYLRQPDEALAQTYLTATERELAFYSRLIGPYPYAKFALVENLWETGFGMPSFTLLGPRVLRLPFLLETSYPHEVLHSWWGNGVYLAAEGGNWSEGLTTYLADHLRAEITGRGAEYRRGLLQKYADYVRASRDFPLREFRGRHDEASQAVGYGKAVMFFHALRLGLGERRFLDGLGRFYMTHRFARAGYGDLRLAFERVSGLNLADDFAQWLDRPGAPRLAVARVRAVAEGDGYRVQGLLRQTQPGPAYTLRVPLALQIDPARPAYEATLLMATKRLAFDIHVRQPPRLLAVDPRFDLFRRLAPEELPPSIGQLFGAERGLIVLPSQAAPARANAYRALADAWAARSAFAVVSDGELKALPRDRAVWVIGDENRFAEIVARAVPDTLLDLGAEQLRVAGHAYARPGHSLVLAAAREHPLGLVVAVDADAVPALARKVPHYSRYGYLVFDAKGENVLKGEWQSQASPLVVPLIESPGPLVLAERPALSAALERGVAR